MQMMEKSLYASSIRKLTDLELIEMLSIYRSEYHHEAISIAESELLRRNIVPDELEHLKFQAEYLYEEKLFKAEEPLPMRRKILCLLLPIHYMFIAIFGLKSLGYVRQAKEARRWTLYGILFYALFLYITTTI